MEKPTEEQLLGAADICQNLGDWVKEKWPTASTEYNILYEAAERLESFAEITNWTSEW